MWQPRTRLTLGTEAPETPARLGSLSPPYPAACLAQVSAVPATMQSLSPTCSGGARHGSEGRRIAARRSRFLVGYLVRNGGPNEASHALVPASGAPLQPCRQLPPAGAHLSLVGTDGCTFLQSKCIRMATAAHRHRRKIRRATHARGAELPAAYSSQRCPSPLTGCPSRLLWAFTQHRLSFKAPTHPSSTLRTPQRPGRPWTPSRSCSACGGQGRGRGRGRAAAQKLQRQGRQQGGRTVCSGAGQGGRTHMTERGTALPANGRAERRGYTPPDVAH